MINKVVYGATVLVDLTDSTVTANNLVSGAVAYDKSGSRITGGVVIQKYYTGASDPSNTLGNNGDLYLKV